MDYKLVISEYADELLNNLIYYLIYRLKNEQAAKHLLDGIDSVYDRLETNPLILSIFNFLLVGMLIWQIRDIGYCKIEPNKITE